MGLRKLSIHLVEIALMALTILFLCVPGSAMADSSTLLKTLQGAISEQIEITGGGFSISPPLETAVPQPITIRSAVVSLPEGETGTLEKIIITGPTGEREFGCFNIKIQNGTDLIKSCGGPAVLEAGKTLYEAQGNHFAPDLDTTFSVSLTSDFLP